MTFLKSRSLSVSPIPRVLHNKGPLIKEVLLSATLLCLAFSLNTSAENGQPQFFDLSLLVAPDLPSTWPAGFPYFQINHYLRFGPLSAYNSDLLIIDGNTGTQLHAPPHSAPPPT